MADIKNKKIKILSIVGVFVTLFILLFVILYSTIYYKADNVDEYLKSTELVNVEINNKYISFTPKCEYVNGFIFYPGAFVEAKSYAPIMYKLAENGVYAAIVKVPLSFALLKTNAAKRVEKDNKNISNWYLSGHSLGGVAATSFYSKNKENINGIVLLASYPTKDISDVDVLSIYGSEDKVLNKKKYEESKKLFPNDYMEVVINGGNHAQFGKYGKQKKDGDSTILHIEQVDITVEAILNFIQNDND